MSQLLAIGSLLGAPGSDYLPIRGECVSDSNRKRRARCRFKKRTIYKADPSNRDEGFSFHPRVERIKHRAHGGAGRVEAGERSE